MNKFKFTILLLFILQSCTIYKRSFGKTFKKIDVKNYEKLYRLDLSNPQLKQTDFTLDKLIALRMLNLSGNTQLNIDNVLKTIPNPELLEVLILDSLNLKNIPKSIIKFTNLKHLSLNYNTEIDLNKTITTINSLPVQFLNLQHNKLVSVPSKITSITTLTHLNLSYNQIANPIIFTYLAKLPKLHSLWLTQNNLTQIHKEIGLLNNVRNLYLEHNKLTSLPIEIQGLKKVRVLHIGHNLFTDLPIQLIKMPSLNLLHINNCKIQNISDNFATSKYSLISILVDNNKLSEKDKKRWRKTFSSFIMASFN